MDTTTARGSVAVLEDGDVRGEVRLTADSHSGRILPAVAFLLDSLGLRPEGMDALAVATGPGSFTGLRVGISTVQGLALAAGLPCVGIPSLDVLGARIRGQGEHLVAWIDAWRGEVYSGLYDGEGRRQGSLVTATPELLLGALPEAAAYAGDGALRYRDLILARHPASRFPERSPYLAGTLARLAAEQAAAGRTTPPEALRPDYLRAADIRPPRPSR